MPALLPILKRLSLRKVNKYGDTVHTTFDAFISKLKLPLVAQALSVSTGDGVWDYSTFVNHPRIKKIVATDIVKNPVAPSDRKMLKKMGDWSFLQVKPEKALPFPDSTFDLLYHLDVIEHVQKPYSFLQDQFRVLKKGGYLLVGTPNLHRPMNLAKILLGKLTFPVNIGDLGHLGSCVHIQEFTQYQLKNMLEETGFKIVNQRSCFFGICPLNIQFQAFPNTDAGKNLCQYMIFLCQK